MKGRTLKRSITVKKKSIIKKPTRPTKPKFYVTKEYMERKHNITRSIIEAFETKNIKIIEQQKRQLTPGIYGLSREARIDLQRYCDRWIKEYIKKNKKE